MILPYLMAFMFPVNITNRVAPLIDIPPHMWTLAGYFGRCFSTLRLLLLAKTQPTMMVQLYRAFVSKYNVMKLFVVVRLLLAPCFSFHLIGISE